MKFLKVFIVATTLIAFIPTPPTESEILKIHGQALTIDTHCDTPLKLIETEFDINTEHKAPESRVDLPRMKKGGLDAIFFAIFTSQKERTESNYDEAYQLTHQMIDSTLSSIKKNSQSVILAKNSNDIFSASGQNKRAIYIGIENGFPIANDISRVEEFYNLGVRYMTLCHTANNDICDSSNDKKGSENNGLSNFGEQVVVEMNRLGMIVDVSHISDSAFFDVIKTSKAPVIASHSSVRSVCDNPRNMSDNMIKTLAKNGGVIQICILGDYIKSPDTTSINYIKKEDLKRKYNNFQYKNDDERKLAWAEWDSINKNYPQALPSIKDAVDHIDYVVNLVGIEYVGIGSDFDGGGGLSDCQDVADFPAITKELINRGYSKNDINLIWGGNFLRVFKEVENSSKQLKNYNK